MASAPTDSRHRSFLLASLALALAVGMACSLTGPQDVGPQGWWDGFGPVIPHDSFPADCTLCHEGSDWNTIRADFQFDHEAETGVPLEGAHAAAQCLRCHNDRGPVAMFAARGCAGCHEDVHLGLLGPECADCHNQENWRPSEQIEKHARTRFPLVGAHVAAACWQCHPGSEAGVFTPVDTRCESCHQSDLQRAVDPDHLASGWTSSCERCHIPVAWKGAGFHHSFWPLTGAHAGADCSACHAGGVYAGTPRQCVACHLDDYLNTNDPDHQAAGFPTTCNLCHNTSGWEGADFDHSFPINGGPHGSLDCSDCHPSPGSFAAFTCIDCHAHTQPDMDDKHSDVNGYQYNSNACLNCHPNGRAEDD